MYFDMEEKHKKDPPIQAGGAAMSYFPVGLP